MIRLYTRAKSRESKYEWMSAEKRDEYRATPLKRAQPLWRARRGFLMHRPRSGVVYLGQEGRLVLDWYCGNFAHNPIPVKPECMEGLESCVICDAKWQAEYNA